MKPNKLVYTLILLLSVITISDAQTKEKIKGDRNVTIKQTYLDSFKTLVIRDDFEVQLAYNSKASIEIETDANLHEAITIGIADSTLTIDTPYRISSKKKMVITVNYSDDLSHIILYDSAEIRSLTSLELESLDLKVSNNSRAYLNVKTNTFNFSATEKTKSRLNITADSSSYTLSDNSKLDALVKGMSSKFDLYQSTDATIEGNAEDVIFRLDNSSKFQGKNYAVKNADVLMEGTSDLSLNVEMLLVLKASGNTETFIYGEPKIELETFTGTAKLQKKDLNGNGLFN